MGPSCHHRLPQIEVTTWQFIPAALCFDFVGKAKLSTALSLLVALMGIGSIRQEICDDTAAVRIGIGWVDYRG
jgi:hypothetical protein